MSSGLARDTLVVGLALTTTALGTLVPMLRDAGVMDTRFGALISAIGTCGEFLPIVAVALLLTKKEPLLTSLLLAAFIVVAVVTVLLAARAQPPRVVAILNRHLESSAQLPVRVSLMFIVLLVLLAETLGLDVLLGAFAAGIVVRLFTASGESAAIRAKLEAIGFGFLIPIFFVVSGIEFDAHVFVAHPSSLWRVPLFLALMLVARGIPVFLLYRKPADRGRAGADGAVLGHRPPADRGDHQHRPGRAPHARRSTRPRWWRPGCCRCCCSRRSGIWRLRCWEWPPSATTPAPERGAATDGPGPGRRQGVGRSTLNQSRASR